ncbi:hypothetical protein AB1Y20_013233 [Prymnesium parvum]|uniref:Maleate isomerase n=1 Tax=Prymnesium parvum TaxID=97485 RepID=A0AB34INL3_PRYPA
MADWELSDGKVYPQRAEPQDAPPGPSTCVFPTEAQLDTLVRELTSRRLSAVSVGAGEGYLEAQLQRRGVAVTAVDLDALADPSGYTTLRCFCSAIRRVRAGQLFRIAESASCALLFEWGRDLPWRQYLRAYPEVPLVVIVGDPALHDGLTEPSASALLDDAEWSLEWRLPFAAVHPSALAAAYSRRTAAPPRATRLGRRPIGFTPPRAVLVAIQIPTDCVLDREGPLMLARVPGVWLRMQKLQFDAEEISAHTFERAAPHVAAAAATLLPADGVHAVGLSCTSMSFVLGTAAVDELLRRGCPRAQTTDMARAQRAALRALGVTRVALVTPYILDLAEKNVDMLAAGGVAVVAHETMGLTHDSMTDKVSKQTITEWAVGVDCGEAEAVVIGCSALRSCEPGFIDQLEEKLQKPVVTSTQAFLWSMLRVAGIDDQIDGYGTLLAKH